MLRTPIFFSKMDQYLAVSAISDSINISADILVEKAELMMKYLLCSFLYHIYI